jgi:crotonobetainyl-CoA:carnitine CoA-transferase CaiB-like acyl-CoA transferase
MPEGALEGIRAIELGQGVSAAYCGKLLADYGAEVIKVEPPGTGDLTRRWGPFPEDRAHREKSGLFFFLNTNKRGVTLDLDSPRGREILLRLVEQADVLIENHRPPQMREWGLDYESLSRVNPDLVMVSITPFGQTGPYAEWKGYDLNAFHLTACGSRYCGRPGEAPLEHGTFSAEFYGAYIAAAWGLAAVVGRDVAGGGQHLDVSCSEAIAALFVGAWNVGGYAQDGVFERRSGVGMSLAAPASIIRCKDGYVWMLALETDQWEGLKRVMGRPEWSEVEMFEDMFVRGRNADLLYPLIEEWSREHTKQEIMDLCQEHGCPTTAVFTVDEVAEHPHLKARGYLVDLEHPEMGTVRDMGAPVRLPESPGGPTLGAPLLGQHNGEVFGGMLGLSDTELDQLQQEGVL